MRMIDADELKTQLYDSIMVNEDMDCLDFLRVESLIDAQPTAYDVDKVVEQLREQQEKLETDILQENLIIGMGNTVMEYMRKLIRQSR